MYSIAASNEGTLQHIICTDIFCIQTLNAFANTS